MALARTRRGLRWGLAPTVVSVLDELGQHVARARVEIAAERGECAADKRVERLARRAARLEA